MMKKRTKWIAGHAAAVIAAGCMMPGSTLAKESMEISQGMFSWFLVRAYDAACSLNGGTTDLWENEIEGEQPEEWILKTAKSYAEEYLAVEQKFQEEELELPEGEIEAIETTQERYWNELGYGRYYADYGITEEDFGDVLEHSSQISQLYEMQRAELEESVTEEEIIAYVEEHGELLQYIAVPYSDVLDEEATAEEKEEWVDTDAIYDEYKERLEQGENMEELVKEVSENEEQQTLGISSSYTDSAAEELFLDNNTSLSNGFQAALEEAEEEEVVYFDDEAQYYQIIFVKKPFTKDWAGLEQYREVLTSLIAGEKFEAQMKQWGEEIELANEADLMDAEQVKEMFQN